MSEDLPVREYDLLVRGTDLELPTNAHGVPEAAFDALRAFFTAPVTGHKGGKEKIARPTLYRSRPALRLQQWVGVIRTPDGTTLEILPKTHEADAAPAEKDEATANTRRMLMRMLATAGQNYYTALPADLAATPMPLFEVILRSALETLRTAVRRGVPHAYSEVREERGVLRGRLDLPRQVRQPPHRAHLLHVVYSSFLPDRPETRLTRLAVERVARLTRRDDTRRLARELLFALGGVSASRHVQQDFRQWSLERGLQHFAPARDSCRLILHELNPLTAGHTARVTAVLFDMNRVFEAYVAHLIRQMGSEWTVQTQVQGRCLGTLQQIPEKGVFGLRPDLLITSPGRELIVADTKWKRLDGGKAFPHGIQNADAYQMLAYGEVFQGHETGRLMLIYPHLPDLPRSFPEIVLAGGRRLQILTVDLRTEHIGASLRALLGGPELPGLRDEGTSVAANFSGLS